MSMNIESIEGIGPKYADMLKGAGIANTGQLLTAGAEPLGRKVLAERAGINESLILKWVNMSDLFRIKGVAGQYAELLEAAGVDTVKELRNRNAENLAEKMQEVNRAKRVVRQVPSAKVVAGWIEQAKTLAPAISY